MWWIKGHNIEMYGNQSTTIRALAWWSTWDYVHMWFLTVPSLLLSCSSSVKVMIHHLKWMLQTVTSSTGVSPPVAVTSPWTCWQSHTSIPPTQTPLSSLTPHPHPHTLSHPPPPSTTPPPQSPWFSQTLIRWTNLALITPSQRNYVNYSSTSRTSDSAKCAWTLKYRLSSVHVATT